MAGRTGRGPHPRRAGNLGGQDPISGNRLGGRSLVCLNPPQHTSPGSRRAPCWRMPAPLPDEEEAWAALKGWLAVRSVADGVRRVGGHRKRKGVPPDNSDPKRLAKILVALLRTRVVELHGDPGGWVPLQAVQDTVAARRTGAQPPTLDEVRAAIVASEGRLELQTTGGTEEYRMRACQGHTGGTTLASLGQPLGSHEPWLVHAIFLANDPSIWKNGLIPHGAPVSAGHTPRQDLYLGMGADPRAKFPNPRTHPCSKLTEGRNIMFWVNGGRKARRERRD